MADELIGILPIDLHMLWGYHKMNSIGLRDDRGRKWKKGGQPLLAAEQIGDVCIFATHLYYAWTFAVNLTNQRIKWMREEHVSKNIQKSKIVH